MNFKLVLALVLFACVWVTDACNRNNVNACSDDANCHIKSTDHHDRRKRSDQKNRTQYSITLQQDPCKFSTYDADDDGAITRAELQAVLGINEEANAFFADLDIMKDDEASVITPDEFFTMAPLIIAECSASEI
ncbi:uncharacterized protein LOC123543976 [Mercenaria mercenaria]|uniref:uncharacterized protein LOC123543976 n=1 Tax=Mercenaria mercenaria TaxID=6596 RepID=UPI001E1DAEE0|nr:uncharacterized protein LOC123543976 [Mercenaria mercenaria]